jgi:hypothetical protein
MAYCDDIDRGLETFCDINLGGIINAYVADFDKVSSYGFTASNTVINSITMGSTASYFYKFNVREDTSKLDIKNTPTLSADLVSQIGTLVFPKLSTIKNSAINLLRGKKLIVIYEDSNGQLWLSGRKFGVRVTNIEVTTGADRNDDNIYTVEFTARETNFPYEVSSKSVIPVAP